MLAKITTLALFAIGALASPVDTAVVEERAAAACPGVHVFGARETTASPGYGSSASVVNSIVSAHSGATSEAISYPACGGQSSCGGVSYANSVSQGTSAVISAVSAFAKKCPSTELVLVGYSQGSEIIDAALCGAGGAGGSLSSYNIKASIWMGNPRFKAGAPYNVGTCKAGGFDSRSGSCGNYNSKIKSYCDVSIYRNTYLVLGIPVGSCSDIRSSPGCRSVLLQRQQCCHSPGLCQRVWLPGCVIRQRAAVSRRLATQEGLRRLVRLYVRVQDGGAGRGDEIERMVICFRSTLALGPEARCLPRRSPPIQFIAFRPKSDPFVTVA